MENGKNTNKIIYILLIISLLIIIGLCIYIISDNRKPLKNNDLIENETITEENDDTLEGIEIKNIARSLLDNNTKYGNYTYMGGTYLRGIQESNYVWYNGFLWRIMGINENGTIRLITEENVGTVAYGASDQGLLYATNEGYINDWLNKYFLNNLDISKIDIIEDSNWCLNVAIDSTSSRTNCDGGNTFKAKVGLITLDEYNLSDVTNYLNNNQTYWTLTPNTNSNIWIVNNSGRIENSNIINYIGVRPVINVSADAIITGGNGDLNDAYILNQTSESKTGKLNENVSSGEYVSLNGKIYRVVSKETNGIKLIYDGYYEESNTRYYTYAFGYNDTFILESGIGKKLNGDVLEWLGNSNKIIESSWYQINGFNYGTKYTTILETKLNPVKAKVGLIRIGEMLSGQSTSMLTKNYTERSNVLNVSNYWTINKGINDANSSWYIHNRGVSSSKQGVSSVAIRPVIVVGNDTTITSGNGVLSNPYIIG